MRPRRCLALLVLLPLLAACERPSVLVVGLDGADWDVMDPLMDAGFLPTMREIVREGSRGEQDCVTALPTFACFCPPVWTSLFTGHDFDRHRILYDHQPASERGVKAIWSVLRDRGGSSISVSMHNNLPVDPDFGAVLVKEGVDIAADQILSTWPPLPWYLRNLPREVLSRPIGLFETLGMLPHEGERPPAWRPIARDRVAMEGLRRLLRHVRADLTVIHLHATDKVAHAMWSTVQPAPGDPIQEGVLLDTAEAWDGPLEGAPPVGWGPVVAPYLEVDVWLGALLAEVPFDYVVLVSDHGMTRRDGPGVPGAHGPREPDAHRGIFAVHGPQVKRGGDVGLVDVTDVAPTLAYLLDLPVADDLPGRVVEELFVEGRLHARPVRRVPTWEAAPESGEPGARGRERPRRR